MSRDVDNSQDILDSRDIIKRMSDLEDEISAIEDGESADPEAVAELAALKALESEAEGYAEDWTHGVALIRDSYFEDYARDFAEDIGAIKSDAQWPNTCIDWEQAARELQMDYTSVEFDGVTYWVR